MLKSMREGAKSTPMRIFLVFLAVGFALWGIGDVFRTVADNDRAVRVGDVEVSALDAAREFDRARRNFLPTSSNSEAVAAGLLSNVLAELTRRTLFVAEGQRMGLTVTRQMEKQAIADEAAFKDELGQFSVLRFRDTLARAGMSEQDYLKFIGVLMMQNQITDAITAGTDYPEATASALARWRLEQRAINIAEVKVDTSSITPPDDAAMLTWYGENSSLFDSPDLRFATVAVISPEVFVDSVDLSEAAINAYYEDNADAWQEQEKRLISQMIFADAARAENAISRINGGESFTDVAEDMLGLSADDVSLGDLTRDDLSGALVEPVFTAASGVVIGPVETPLGQHVLMVNEITAAEMTPLADVRDRIIEDLKRENATDLVYDRISVLEDEIAAGATIEEAARVSGAAIVSIDGMDRNGLGIDGNVIEGIAADTTFRERLWAAAINDEGMVEDIGEDTFFVARVEREQAARSRDLAEVRDRVIEVMIGEMAITAARTTAESIIGASDTATAAQAAGAPFGDETSLRRDGVGLDHSSARLIAAKAFELAPGEVGIVETGDEAIVVSVDRIIPADAEQAAAEMALFQSQLSNEARNSMVTGLLLGFQKQFDVEVTPAPVQQMLIGAAN